MRTLIWVAMVALLASALLAVQATAAAPQACAALSQAGMRDCLLQKHANSAAYLKQAEEKMVQAIAQWDEDRPATKLAQQRLLASQAAFEKFGQAQCAYAAALGGKAAGNALEVRRLNCMIDMNSARAAQLLEQGAALPRK